MSSTSGLSRTRSVRKPAAGGHEFGKKDGPVTRSSEARTTSPSRLPVKPTMTTRSAAANSSSTAATTARTRAASSTTGRPLSGVYSKPPLASLGNGATRALGRAASTRQPPSSTTGGTSTVTRTASTATGRPRSSGGPPPTTSSNRLMGHSRSKSTVTSLTSATTLRPRPVSSQQSSTSSGRSSPTASTISTVSSKPQTRSHTRAKSQSQTTTMPPPPPPAVNRPAFNNHQQHYSPAKSLAPKPLTSTYLAPPSPSKLPANVALSAETSRLQTELLQLSLLGRDAADVAAEWRESARQKLGARFARLAGDDEALLQLERRGIEARNVAALVRWGGEDAPRRGGRGRGLEDKVQMLDEVLNGVWQLGEPGGRYERVVQGFETWADQMAAIVAAQRGGDADALVGDGEEVRFLGELDRGWKHDCLSLARKLEGWRALLYELGDVDDDDQGQRSGVGKMLDGCRALVRDMLSELAVMEQIERDATRAEDAWIESMNKAIEDEADDTPAARAYVPLWKLAV
ncbi:hypothetical protein GGR53DRAFT_417355 [Hypoxylon sp. FL1150]|nr:hypothetical protein GGR53DRAFT_417355 [Hypoxylon sp. FL1150]